MADNLPAALVRDLWAQSGLPSAAMTRLSLSNSGALLSSSFQVGAAAQSAIAAAALAATEVAVQRGRPELTVRVDQRAAELECTGYFTLDGELPDAWAPLSGLYPCADGYVRIHANFDHHRDGALALLDIPQPPGQVSREMVASALRNWSAEDFETAASEKGLPVTAARDFAGFDQTAQGRAVRTMPLISITRIGEAEPRVPVPLRPGQKPLTGIRVLDLTRILAGPVCGRTLATYGADVMLINSPRLPNIRAIVDTSRGKRSAWLDLEHTEGRKGLENLIRDANVFVQAYSPDSLARRGYGPAELAALSPGIVVTSLSAWGTSGPWASRKGFDSLVQTAMGFNMAEAQATGSDIPRALPVQILDFASGFLMALGAQTALLRQMQSGGSYLVEVSLARTALWLRSMGRCPLVVTDQPDWNGLCTDFPSAWGELRAAPHGAEFSDFDTRDVRPSVPPGTDAPVW
ncbi:MAG: CoA transferase [Pseudomonadales bacterium]|nr:CoA transferase [Pseudomonadales bacterium]